MLPTGPVKRSDQHFLVKKPQLRGEAAAREELPVWDYKLPELTFIKEWINSSTNQEAPDFSRLPIYPTQEDQTQLLILIKIDLTSHIHRVSADYLKAGKTRRLRKPLRKHQWDQALAFLTSIKHNALRRWIEMSRNREARGIAKVRSWRKGPVDCQEKGLRWRKRRRKLHFRDLPSLTIHQPSLHSLNLLYLSS